MLFLVAVVKFFKYGAFSNLKIYVEYTVTFLYLSLNELYLFSWDLSSKLKYMHYKCGCLAI